MPVRLTLKFTLLIVAILIPGRGAYAQEAAKWTARADPAKLKQGEATTVKVTAKINDGWHIYSATPHEEGPVATSFSFPKSLPLVKTGKVRQPKPIVKFDENFGIDTEYYEEDVTFSVPAKVKSDAKTGEQKFDVEVEFMACNDRMCLPPKTIKVPVTLVIEEGAGVAEQSAVEDDTTAVVAADGAGTAKEATVSQQPSGYGDEADVEAAKKKGFWAYIGLAMSVGALALLTPCVFPMIPITVSFFTKRDTATRGRAVRDAFIYSFGIIFTFTVLGIVLAVTLGASGINQFAANPWMNILIATVFIVFALNLFGLFEIVVPSGILTKLTVASGSGHGITSLLLMGLTFTLTSFTCTVPFVGTVMVAASSGEIWWSVVGMLAFSAIFAFPFFLLALFPSWLKSLPKSGGWLNSVKVVMGFLELAAAMKFISNVDLIWHWGVLSRDLFLAFWVGIGLLIFFYLIGLFQLPHDSKPERIGVMRLMFSLFFLGTSIFLYTGLNGKPLGEIDAFMPPINYQETIQMAGGDPGAAAIPQGNKGGTSKENERWITDYAEAMRIAKMENKRIFIDFTGFACTNCRWMEANLFTRNDVQQLLKNFVLVRLYTDGRGETYVKNQAMQERRFGTVALPFYAVMTAEDQVVQTFPGMTRKPQEFVTFLTQGLKQQLAAL